MRFSFGVVGVKSTKFFAPRKSAPRKFTGSIFIPAKFTPARFAPFKVERYNFAPRRTPRPS